MPVRFQHSDKPTLYFVTFTCYDWLPLFALTKGYDLVYKWFHYLKDQKGINVTAFVIMPDHLHCILHFSKTGHSLNKIIGNAKRFMAYEIIERLKMQKQTTLLQKLADAVTAHEQKKGQVHKVFKDSFDAKAIDTEKFFYQKQEYIHKNPATGNYKLVEDWREYEHSSASYYELSKVHHFTPVHYLELR